jgi:hypothetical protein
MAIGMYTGSNGNTLYCPTGYLELLRLQDRFVYLPELPYREKRSLSGNEAVRTVGEAPRAVRKHGNGSFPSAGQDH